MDADGRRVSRLTDNAYIDEYPAWSPDGSKIAFASLRDGSRGIYVMNADGTNQTRLTSDLDQWTDLWPTWSPDGSRIAFWSRRGSDGDIHVVNTDGSGEIRITDTIGVNEEPAWSPVVSP
ncbi:MAG: hypothetical protein O3A47_13645 [Chloroflexi bacterium]|nr:hypothetical protein [Chloroflexota bacterium]